MSDVNRTLGPEGQGNGIAWPGVHRSFEFVQRHVNRRIVRVVLDVRHHDLSDFHAQMGRETRNQIVTHRSGRNNVFQCQANGSALSRAHPNGKDVGIHLVSQDHNLGIRIGVNQYSVNF